MSFELHNIVQQIADNSGTTTDQYRWNKIIAICGPGGSRVDAVTAWLDNQSSQTGCIQPNWRIEPATGRTALPTYNLWLFDRFNYNKPIVDDLAWLQTHYNKAGVSLIQKHHNPTHLNDLLCEDLRPHVDYLYITASSDPELLIDMTWEFIAKTILQPPWRPHLFGFSKNSIPTTESINELIFGNLLSQVNRVYNFSVDVNFIDYADLVSETGSYKICQSLNIEVPEFQHEVWRRGVAAGKSPQQVYNYGITWSRDDVARIYEQVIKS